MTQRTTPTPSFERDALVPDKSHYNAKYLLGGRMFSFAHQVEHVLSFDPRQVLEIGPGPRIVTHALRAAGVDVKTLDVEPTLRPDILGSVTDIPLEDGAVDVIVCCQVLEHLPFDQFVPALRELRRVARVGAVISLPDITPAYFVLVNLPLLHRRAVAFSRRLRNPPAQPPRNRHERDGHYWEIGVEGFPAARVRGGMRQAGWRIRREFRTNECPFHHFFVLERAV